MKDRLWSESTIEVESCSLHAKIAKNTIYQHGLSIVRRIKKTAMQREISDNLLRLILYFSFLFGCKSLSCFETTPTGGFVVRRPEIQPFLQQIYARTAELGSRGQAWMIDDLLTENEMSVIVSALRQNYISVRRFNFGGTRYIQIDLTEAGLMYADEYPMRIAS